MCHNLTAIDEQVKTVLNATVFNMKIDRKRQIALRNMNI